MQLQLEQAQVKYHISPGIVTIDELLLRSPNIRLTATGTISFRGKLQLDSRLALNDKIRRQLFSPIRANFQPLQDPPGYAAVDFNGERTVHRPRTDLMEARRARPARPRQRHQQPLRPSKARPGGSRPRPSTPISRLP